MTISSHRSLGDMSFGAAFADFSKLGIPQRERMNRRGEKELHFDSIIYRFDRGKFVEATFALPQSLEINGIEVEGKSLVSFLRQKDLGYREKHGFAVAPALGLAVDLDDATKNWVTAFALGRWDDVV